MNHVGHTQDGICTGCRMNVQFALAQRAFDRAVAPSVQRWLDECTRILNAKISVMKALCLGLLIGVLFSAGATWAGHESLNWSGTANRQWESEYGAQQRENAQREERQLDRMLRPLGPC